MINYQMMDTDRSHILNNHRYPRNIGKIARVSLTAILLIFLFGCSVHIDYPQAECGFNFSQQPLEPIDTSESWMYAGESVSMRALSCEDAPIVRTLSCRVVQVITTVNYCTTDWALIYSPDAAQLSGAIGWVKLSDLISYTASASQPVLYPVKVREGTTDSDTGEIISSTGEIWISSYEGSDAIVYWEGGERHRIAQSNILFPVLQNGELHFN